MSGTAVVRYFADAGAAERCIRALIAAGWKFNIPVDEMGDEDWLGVANGVIEYMVTRMDAEKVIPVGVLRDMRTIQGMVKP